jgi:uncharacterized protein YerC
MYFGAALDCDSFSNLENLDSCEEFWSDILYNEICQLSNYYTVVMGLEENIEVKCRFHYIIFPIHIITITYHS